MLVYVILSTIALVAGVVIAYLVHNRSRMDLQIEPHQETVKKYNGRPLPLISVIIPARDECRNIERCLQALFAQTYPNFELIVVDDRSSDETPLILAKLAQVDKCLHILHGEELPDGWAGKPHALVQGAQLAQGEWLCFMDADTFAEPELLMSAYDMALEQGADMFSILTEQELGSFWERTILPLVFMGLSYGFPAQRVNDPARLDAISNGQFILIKSTVYNKIGGHGAVKDRVDEDKAIAAIVKHAGFRLVLADGRKVARTRMYTTLPEMWEGWTKNIYPGLQDRPWLLLFGAVLGLVVTIGLPLWLFGSLAWLGQGGGRAAWIVAIEAAAMWGYLLFLRLRAGWYFGLPAGYAFTFPLGAMIFTAMMFASVFKIISGSGVTWKGRRYH